MSYQLKYTLTFEKQIEKIKKKDKPLEEAMKKVEKMGICKSFKYGSTI